MRADFISEAQIFSRRQSRIQFFSLHPISIRKYLVSPISSFFGSAQMSFIRVYRDCNDRPLWPLCTA